MRQLSNVTASVLIGVVVGFFVKPADLQAQKGDLPSNLTAGQREIVEQVVKLAKQYHEAAKQKNKIAKQDALKQHESDLKSWLDETNKKLAKEGIKEWVGNAAVSTQALVIENRVFLDNSATGGTFTSVKVSIPIAGLTPEIRDQVGKLKKNENIKVSFSPDAKNPLVFAKSSLTGFSAQLKSAKGVTAIGTAENK